MKSRKTFFGPPGLRAYDSCLQSEPQISSPTGTDQYANSLSPINSPEPNKKKVNFDGIVSIILIPSRIEYFNANIADNVWSNNEEIKEYKKSAFNELLQLMSSQPNLSLREAFLQLYHSEVEEIHNEQNLGPNLK